MGIIFDLDGVLVDTVPAHFSAWQRMFSEYGYEFGKREYRHMVDGRPRFDGARAIMTEHSDTEIRHAADKKNDYYIEMIERGEFRVFETALTLIQQSQELGLKLAAASSSANVRTVLEKANLIDAFSVVVGGEDVKNGKPNPDIFLAASADLGLSVDECIVIEDSSSGIEAAKRGGFTCIGLLHEDHAEELSGADMVVTSLAEIDLERLVLAPELRANSQ